MDIESGENSSGWGGTLQQFLQLQALKQSFMHPFMNGVLDGHVNHLKVVKLC